MTDKRYEAIGRYVYIINSAHMKGAYTTTKASVAFNNDGTITLKVVGKDEDSNISVTYADASAVEEILKEYADCAMYELSKTNIQYEDRISSILGNARENMRLDGFDLTQEAWNTIYKEAMESWNKLEV